MGDKKTKILTRDVCQFMYKWRNDYNKSSEYLTITPRQYMYRHEKEIDNIVQELMREEYTKQKTNTCVYNKNKLQHPDVLVCETLCLNDDRVIRTIGIDQYGYVIISSYGTLITYFGSYKVEKLGTFQYTDKLLELIRNFKNTKSVEKWKEMMEDLSEIQEHIMMY